MKFTGIIKITLHGYEHNVGVVDVDVTDAGELNAAIRKFFDGLALAAKSNFPETRDSLGFESPDPFESPTPF